MCCTHTMDNLNNTLSVHQILSPSNSRALICILFFCNWFNLASNLLQSSLFKVSVFIWTTSCTFQQTAYRNLCKCWHYFSMVKTGWHLCKHQLSQRYFRCRIQVLVLSLSSIYKNYLQIICNLSVSNVELTDYFPQTSCPPFREITRVCGIITQTTTILTFNFSNTYSLFQGGTMKNLIINSSIWLTSWEQNRKDDNCGTYRYKESYVEGSITQTTVYT